MDLKNILVPLTYGDIRGRSVLDVSSTIALACKAHMDGLFVSQYMPQFSSVGNMSGSAALAVLEDAKREAEEASDAALEEFKLYVASRDLPFQDPEIGVEQASAGWLSVNGNGIFEISKWGCIADMIVVERPNSGHEPDGSAIAEAALTRTRKPVLVVPVSFGADEIKDKIEDWKVLVCWNRSAHAASAASNALPILKRAKKVELLNILTDAKEGPSASDFANYLGRHGVRASVKEVEPSARAVGPAILEEAHTQSADLIVMGAYSYSRLRALIMGGVTRHVLDSAEIPVMMTR